MRGLALALLRLGNYAEAATFFQKAAQATSNSMEQAECMLKAADACHADRRYEQAAGLYTQVAGMDGDPARTAPAEIRLDVEETNDAYLVRADLPGIPKDQIQVEINEDVVKISVEYKRETPADAKSRRIERTVGAASRAIRLPVAVDAARADAKHVDGVLQLTLPKSAPVAKRLTIN